MICEKKGRDNRRVGNKRKGRMKMRRRRRRRRTNS